MNTERRAMPRGLTALCTAALSASLLYACGCSAAMAADAALRPVIAVPLSVMVPVAPIAFRGDGLRHLVYEIQTTNFSTTAWTLKRIEVLGQNGAHLRDFDGTKPGLLWHPGRAADSKDGAVDTLAPGETVIAFLWIDLADAETTPAQLNHRFIVARSGDSAEYQLDAPSTTVGTKLRSIGAPLAGKNWLAANGPSNSSPHRRSMLVLDGMPHIAQRYAIDWVQVGADLLSFHGDPTDNRSYLCFGVNALAVADGVVAEIKDGVPENVPNQPPAVAINLSTVAGNHIDLDLGGGVYAMYAHLQPGSLRVKVGDKVKRGQVLALVGNTGNSSEPHLHFQLMTTRSPLNGDGLPYVLSDFRVSQKIEGDFPQLTAVPLAVTQTHHGEMPVEMQLVEFQ